MPLRLVKPGKNKTAITSADLAAEIQRLRDRGAAACVERDRLLAERQSASSYAVAREMGDRIEELGWQIEHDAGALERLDAELAATKAEEHREALILHRETCREAFAALLTAILAATDAQTRAMKTREAAIGALGEAAVAQNIPPIAFRGFLLPDLVGLWKTEQARAWSAPWSPPVPQPVASGTRRRVDPKRDLPAQPIARQGIARIGGTVPASRPPIYTGPPAEAPKPPRPLHADKTAGVAAHLIKFIRGGADLDWYRPGDAARLGDVIAAPERIAIALVKNSAAVFIEESRQ